MILHACIVVIIIIIIIIFIESTLLTNTVHESKVYIISHQYHVVKININIEKSIFIRKFLKNEKIEINQYIAS
jgi:hypothetical protein